MPSAEMQMTPALSSKDMPYVAFESRTEEDKKASNEEGRIIMREKHYARITPPGSRDVHYEAIPEWWGKLELEAKTGRILPEWLTRWQANYEQFKKGQEIPLEGTPIRGWKLLTGAQQEMCIQANILTVEDLATIPAEGISRIGMGGQELRRRAEAWLIQWQSSEEAIVKLLALQRENDVLKETVANLTSKVEELSAQIDTKGKKK